MKGAAWGAALLVWSCAVVAAAQETHPVLTKAAEALGVDRIRSLEYTASGRYFQFSQQPSPFEPYPPFEARDYVAALDYERDQSHVKYRRTQVVEPQRLRPPPVEQAMDQFVKGEFAWNLAPNPTSLPQNAQDRHAEIWGSPQGFIKAAIAQRAKVKPWKESNHWVTFDIGPRKYEGGITPSGRVLLVRTWVDTTVLGDTEYEFHYGAYDDFGGVIFPKSIRRVQAGHPLFELTVSSVRINTAEDFEVPAEVRANPLPSVEVKTATIAPGVFYLLGGSHHSVAIERKNHVVVVEAPLDERRSLAVIEAVGKLIPNKPIRYVINTHVHFDHAGGLRTYVQRGAQVVTADINARYYAKAWARPRTLNPDLLAKSRKKARFVPVTRKLVLEDAARSIEVHEIARSGHADGFLMVYLPNERLLIQGDAWTPTPDGAAPPSQPNPYWVNLYENVLSLKLDVRHIAPLHGAGLKTFDDLHAAVKSALPAIK